jgi:hypothetical protein
MRLLIVLILLHLTTTSWAVELKKQKDLNFTVNTSELYQGNLHYSTALISVDKILEKYPELTQLDALNIIYPKGKKIRLFLTKSAVIVNRPVGFFDNQTINDTKFIQHLWGEQKVERVSEGQFKVLVSGEGQHSYQLNSYFDSDDLSTLPNSQLNKTLGLVKKLEVLCGSATATIIHTFSDYSKYAEGSTLVRSFIPLKENKTLIISFGLMAIHKEFAKKLTLEKNFTDELKAHKELIENYKKE